tara:strand:+ start:1125 stop:1277 length:153 start_codon:yes stop_codon:yes gene_type:complete
VEINLLKNVKIILKNVTELKGNWIEAKVILKQKFAKLTDSYLLLIRRETR